MKKILFYNSDFHKYDDFKNIPKKTIIDYYDIEVQKILRLLGFSFVSNPTVIEFDLKNSNSNRVIDILCDIKTLSITDKKHIFNTEKIIGVVFDCYK